VYFVASKKKYSVSKRKKSPLTYEGYIPHEVVKEKKEVILPPKNQKKTAKSKKSSSAKEKPQKITIEDYAIMCGPLKQNQKSVLEMLPFTTGQPMTPEIQGAIENQWMPQPKLTVFDQHSGAPLTAQEATEKRKESPKWTPLYYTNPMQSYDYLVYESLYKNTIIGPVMNQLVKFIMGTGFKPELELRNPTGDTKADKKLIEANQEIVNKLMFVDRCITEKTDEEGSDLPFPMKIQNLILNTLVYNRACAVKIYDEQNPIVIDETPYPNIPVGYVDFHPRDIGIVRVSPETNKMESVQIQQITGFQKMDEMIYFWNADFGGPVYLSKYYGASMLMPMIEPARLIRNQVASILPAVAENMAGGLYHIFVQPQGGTKQQKASEYQSITQAAQFGTANVFMIDPDRVKYQNVNFDPKIGELITLFESMVRYIVASAKLPQIGFYDESAANHATAVERIQLAISIAINPMRESFGGELARQHYMPIFRELYKDDEEKLELFRIKVEWDDLQVETLTERAEALETLENAGVHLDDEKKEEMLQIDGLTEHLEEDDQQQNPMLPNQQQQQDPQKQRFKVKDRQSGEKFTIQER
jgi:hypothetical protein